MKPYPLRDRRFVHQTRKLCRVDSLPTDRNYLGLSLHYRRDSQARSSDAPTRSSIPPAQDNARPTRPDLRSCLVGVRGFEWELRFEAGRDALSLHHPRNNAGLAQWVERCTGSRFRPEMQRSRERNPDPAPFFVLNEYPYIRIKEVLSTFLNRSWFNINKKGEV